MLIYLSRFIIVKLAVMRIICLIRLRFRIQKLIHIIISFLKLNLKFKKRYDLIFYYYIYFNKLYFL